MGVRDLQSLSSLLVTVWALPLNLSLIRSFVCWGREEGQVEHQSESEFKNAGRSLGPKALWAGPQRS